MKTFKCVAGYFSRIYFNFLTSKNTDINVMHLTHIDKSISKNLLQLHN